VSIWEEEMTERKIKTFKEFIGYDKTLSENNTKRMIRSIRKPIKNEKNELILK